MFKNGIRQLVQRFGYDFVKTSNFEHGRKYKRISPDPRFDYYELINRNFYLPKNCKGDLVANAIKTNRVFDEVILDVAKSFVIPNSVILDIGANYGQMAIEFSRIANDTVVYAFEAQKMVFDVLEMNLEVNGIKNVKAFYNAVYDKDDMEFSFPIPDLKRFPSYGSYGLDLTAKVGLPVKSLSIDSLHIDKPISFMKIDIQGSDLAAMRGSVATIQKHKMPIIFEYEEELQRDFNTSFQDYVDFVDSIGYTFIKTIQGINYLIMPR